MDRFSYGSLAASLAQVIPAKTDKAYIHLAIPTPPEAAELVKHGLGNVFSDGWQQLLQDAVARNGGLGDVENGFLAFSKIGFVRFYNDNLSAEQNRKLASMSLEMGFAIEDMPARAPRANENIDRWVNEFISEYESSKEAFLQDPKKALTVKDGRRRYEVKLDPNTGAAISRYYKKSGGIRGFIQKNFKTISKITDLVGKVGSYIPGWGKAIAAVAKGVKFVSTLAAQSSLKLRNVIGKGISFLSEFVSGKGVTGKAIKTGLNKLGEAIDQGKNIFTSLFSKAKAKA